MAAASGLRSLAEYALDLRDADVDPFKHISVHGLRRAPYMQRMQFLLKKDVKFAKGDAFIRRQFWSWNTFEQRLCSLPVVLPSYGLPALPLAGLYSNRPDTPNTGRQSQFCEPWKPEW